MATHSSILAWKISWMEPGRLQSMESKKGSDMTEGLPFTSLQGGLRPSNREGTQPRPSTENCGLKNY